MEMIRMFFPAHVFRLAGACGLSSCVKTQENHHNSARVQGRGASCDATERALGKCYSICIEQVLVPNSEAQVALLWDML